MTKQVRTGDIVLVLSGADKGKKGKVLGISPKKGLVKVENVHVVARHTKSRTRGQKGNIVHREAYFPLCAVKAVEAAPRKQKRAAAAQNAE